MERAIAGWFAEGSSYLFHVWAGKGVPGNGDYNYNNNNDDVDHSRESRGRSCTHDSNISSTSSVSVKSSSSNKKLSKVMGWMVFGSRKNSKKCNNNGPVDNQDIVVTSNRKNALDILMEMNSTRPTENIILNDLRAVSVVGRGGYGKVMLMRNYKTNKVYALKEISKSNLIEKPKVNQPGKGFRPTSTKIEHAEMERLVLGMVSEHPFITTFYGSFQTRDKLFITTQYAHGGELFGIMQRQGIFPENRVRLYVAEIVSALEHLHKKNIIYRDLKPENILLDVRGHIVLTDFGLSIAFNSNGDDNDMRCFSICGTPEYISPEVVLGATTKKNSRSWSYGKTVDWWALGILTYEMLYRLPPFFDRERKVMLEKIVECSLQFPEPTAKNNFVVSQSGKDFIAALLKYNEHERLGYGNKGSSNVKSHAFFSCLDWQKVNNKVYEPEYVPNLKNELDTSCFDPSFTKELLRESKCSKCAFNLDLNGYDDLSESDNFSESIWYKKTNDLKLIPNFMNNEEKNQSN